MLDKISKQNKIIIGICAICLIAFFILKPSSIVISSKTAEVKEGAFTMEVEATGEIQALKYENIAIPSLLKNRKLRIWGLKITDLVAEGTQVKKGDYVATLDPADVEDRLKKSIEKVDEYQLAYDNAALDTTIALVAFRDEIINAADDIIEKEIKVEQSKFESKAIQRQTAIELELAQLNLTRKKRTLNKEQNRHKVKINRANKRLKDALKLQNQYTELVEQLKIKSPSDGMVVYARGWGGHKVKVNSDVGPWSPTIAIIPDLNTLVSESIVKEIDIAKVKVGQKVKIGIDAFPDDEFKGEVMRIANIGQPISGTGMNGFKVLIQINAKGKKILPSMTTTNVITVADYTSELILPREAIFGNDTIKYVFKKTSGLPLKTYIKTGGENESQMRITEGLNKNETVLLTRPKKFE